MHPGALDAYNLTAVAPHGRLRCNELVAEALVIPFGMIVGQVLLDHVYDECCFAQHHHEMLGFLLDRAHKPFTIRIEIRTPWGQNDRFNTAGLEQPSNACVHFVSLSWMR